MRILLVCSDFPYPANHGSRVDTWGRIKALHSLGIEIHLVVCGTQQNPSVDEMHTVRNYIDEITIVPHTPSITNLFSMFPFQVKKREALKKIAFKEEYEFIILEGDAMYTILDNPTLKNKNSQVIIRVHNNEIEYFKALARSSNKFIHKLYYLTESLKFKYLSRKIIDRVNNYMFISNDEFEKFISKNTSKNCIFLPPPINLANFISHHNSMPTVVFIGSLFMPNNREGIEWFLKYIHPRMLQYKSEYRFIIAGNSKNQKLTWLNKYNLERVDVIDTPERLDEIYQSACIFINPMQNGAGVKLKTIEAIQNGLPVVSTSTGCEGTGLINGTHIIVADDTDQFYIELIKLIENEEKRNELLHASQQFIKERYNHRDIISNFLKTI